jgi:hypothetical protein
MPPVFIEFAGLCIGVNEPTRTRILLPHTRSVGGPAHSPVLLIRDHAGLIGTPHFTITMPDNLDEYAGWYLSGKVRMSGITEKYQPPDNSPIQNTLPKTWRSVQYLANLRDVAGTNDLQDPEVLPLAAEMSLEHGRLEAVGFTDQLTYNYEYEIKDAQGKTKKKMIYPKPRLRAERAALRLSDVTAPFKFSFMASGGSPEIVTVDHTVTSRIVVSNLTAASAQGVSHLDTYYECVKAQFRPRVVRYLPNGKRSKDDFPYNPDQCMFAFF